MYKEARFSSDGWCPTESGDNYLKIDLQNEYHITRVMVMGDKNQTKWSGSYSLKYSHDESLVDNNSAVQVCNRISLLKSQLSRLLISSVFCTSKRIVLAEFCSSIFMHSHF